MGALPRASDVVVVGLSLGAVGLVCHTDRRGLARAVGGPPAPTPALPWRIDHLEAEPDALFSWLPEGSGRSWRWRVPTRSALVLGRAQPEHHVDRALAERRGITVVRRVSGGSAVLLRPGAVLWADVVVPSGDPLWDDDIGRATWWVGEAWAGALGALGVPDLAVHRGPMTAGPSAERVCFAGLGAGEVTVSSRKIVGISQRRTRHWALFQCALLLEWDALETCELLGVNDDLSQVAAGLGAVGVGATGADAAVAVLNALP